MWIAMSNLHLRPKVRRGFFRCADFKYELSGCAGSARFGRPRLNFERTEKELKWPGRSGVFVRSRRAKGSGKAADLERKHGISDAALYNWKAKYGGVEMS
jgi:hypothetical protein